MSSAAPRGVLTGFVRSIIDSNPAPPGAGHGFIWVGSTWALFRVGSISSLVLLLLKAFSPSLLLIWLCKVSELTFSSPDATLNTSSTTEPTARRAALDECTSFQMVSLSTCKHKHTHAGMCCLNHKKNTALFMLFFIQ